MNELTKTEMIELLRKWISQRAGLDPADYGIYPGARDIASARSAYRSEARRITQQGQDARRLLSYVEASQITADTLREAFRAFSGRLQLTEHNGKPALDYCTGQYFPTEYRAAACAVLAQAIWDYHRPDYMNDERPGDSLRAAFVRIFGRPIAKRWFN